MLKDFPAFARTMADLGVTRLELCSPIGYGQDFASLANGKEVRKILADLGMKGREFPTSPWASCGRARKRASSGEGCRDHADDDRDPGRWERR